jgi:Ca-activated chloride channel family protein
MRRVLPLIALLLVALPAVLTAQEEDLLPAGPGGLQKRGWVLFERSSFVKDQKKVEVSEAELGGRQIDYVAFYVDGELVAIDEVPPFSIIHDFGSYTHKARIVAIGYRYQLTPAAEASQAGEAKASTEATTEAAAEVSQTGEVSEAVRIVSPGAGQYAYGVLPIRAEVDLPADAILRIDFLVDGRAVGSAGSPPFEIEYDFGRGFEGRLVQAIAVLTDGRRLSAELRTTPLESSDYYLRTRLVTLDATVVDWRDRLVGDLKQEEFRVYEDGVEQAISNFSIEERPIRVALLIDTSSSMRHLGRMGRAIEAAKGFLDYLKPGQDQATLVAFNDQVEVLNGFSDDFRAMKKKLDKLEPEGGTAINDALYRVTPMFDDVIGRKAIILLSDGWDENSEKTIGEAVETVRRAGVKVYSIAIFEEDVYLEEAMAPPPSKVTKQPPTDPEDARRGDDKFRRGNDPRKVLFIGLADETGGASFFPGDLKNLPGVFTRIAEELRHMYSIGYIPKNADFDGRWRDVKVNTTRSGLTVRTKRGYYAEK